MGRRTLEDAYPVNLNFYDKIPLDESICIKSYSFILRNTQETSVTPEEGYINSDSTVSVLTINTTIITQPFYSPINGTRSSKI